MPTTDELNFELERRVVLFKSGTVMPDGSLLGYNGNPNSIPASNLTAGETLIKNCPVGTLYIQDNGDMWRKTVLSSNTWVAIGTGSGGGTGGSTTVYLPASANWNTTYATVCAFSGSWGGGEGVSLNLPASANWQTTYTTVCANSGDWDHSSFGYLTTIDIPASASWQTTYTTVCANSADWDHSAAGYLTSIALPASANWNSVYNTVSAASAFWSTGGVYLPASGNWTSTYTTVCANSADWDHTTAGYLTSIALPASANWQTTYTTVCANSGDWDHSTAGYLTSVNLPASANWQTTYTTVCANSGDWDHSTAGYLTSVNLPASANWQTTYTTVCANSADWDHSSAGYLTTVSIAASANWQTTYTTVCANSGDWDHSAAGYLTSIALPASANWQTTYTTVCANSADWDHTTAGYLTGVPASGAWQTTYTTVSANSATWQQAYSLIQSNSAAWGSARGDGSSGSGSVIAPFAYASMSNATSGEGTNIDWYYTFSTNTISKYEVEFHYIQPNASYTVVTDAQTRDTYNMTVSNKTVSGFDVDIDVFGTAAQDPSGVTILVYGQNPLIGTGNTSTPTQGGTTDLTGISGVWQSTYTTVSSTSADWNLGAASWTTIQANSASWLGSGSGGNTGGSGAGAAGAFLTNITCGNNNNKNNGITILQEESNEIAVDSEVPVVSALVDTPTVRLYVQWEGSATQWTGTPYVNNQPIARSNTTAIGGAHTRRFEGFIDLDLTSSIDSTATIPVAYDGVTKNYNIQVAGGGPEVTNFQVTSTPQHGQDHYKDGDSVTFTVEFDTADVTSISLNGTGNTYATISQNDIAVTMTGLSATVTTTVDSGLSSPTARPFNITAKNSLGTEGTAHITSKTIEVMNGPRITDITFGAFPSTFGVQQTELKNGDTIDCTLTFDTTNVNQVTFLGDTTHVNGNSVVNNPILAGNSTTVTLTVGNTTISNNNNPGGSLLPARAQARHTGTHQTPGPLFTSSNTVRVNNQTPTITVGSVTYNNGFAALKDSDTADVTLTVTNQGQMPQYEYTTLNGELSMTNPFTYSATKTVTRASGDYRDSGNNHTLTVKRIENGTQSSAGTTVLIANIAPKIEVFSNSSNDTQGTRMRSGGNDTDVNGNATVAQNYNVRLKTDQLLWQLPTLAVGTGNGTLGNFTGNLNGTIFNATLNVHDDDNKGTFQYTNLVAMNIAGKQQNTIFTGAGSASSPNYTLGGFVKRKIQKIMFQPGVSINVLWSDYTKLTFLWDAYPNTTFNIQPAGTTTNTPNGWTITGQNTSNTGTTPITVTILDLSKIGAVSNFSNITVEETV